jgi:intein/homing endonuclease
MLDFHNKWGIKIDKNVKNYISICYGDTDSVVGSTIIHTNNGDRTIEELFNENYNNGRFYTHNGHELVSMDDKILNWDNGLYYGDVKYIMRHKVSKPKWRLKTKSGKEVIVTNDHSMIVFRDGEKIEVKPYEILPTDKILVING